MSEIALKTMLEEQKREISQLKSELVEAKVMLSEILKMLQTLKPELFKNTVFDRITPEEYKAGMIK